MNVPNNLGFNHQDYGLPAAARLCLRVWRKPSTVASLLLMNKWAVNGEPHVTCDVVHCLFLHFPHHPSSTPPPLQHLFTRHTRKKTDLFEIRTNIRTFDMFSRSLASTSPCPSARSSATAALTTAAPTSAVIRRMLPQTNLAFHSSMRIEFLCFSLSQQMHPPPLSIAKMITELNPLLFLFLLFS